METAYKILAIDFQKLNKNNVLYVITHFVVKYEENSLIFDTFCQRIFDLMIKDEIAFEVRLTLCQIPDESKHDQYYNNVYISYFNEKRILKDYKPPQCNKYCVPLATPTMSFEWDSKQEWSELVVMNVISSNNFN